MLNFILNLFKTKRTKLREENERKIRNFEKRFKQWFIVFHTDLDMSIKPIFYSYGITNFQFNIIKNIPTIIITLERPGILIGKGGRNIEDIKKFLIESSNITDLDVSIMESKLWKNIYQLEGE